MAQAETTAGLRKINSFTIAKAVGGSSQRGAKDRFEACTRWRCVGTRQVLVVCHQMLSLNCNPYTF